METSGQSLKLFRSDIQDSSHGRHLEYLKQHPIPNQYVGLSLNLVGGISLHGDSELLNGSVWVSKMAAF